MLTSAIFYHVAWFLNITIEIRNVCVFLAPMFSSFTVLVTYQLTKELKVRQHLYQFPFNLRTNNDTACFAISIERKSECFKIRCKVQAEISITC